MTKDMVVNRSIVCMDGRYNNVLETIYKTIMLAAEELNDEMFVHPLAMGHFDKIVFKFRATKYQMDAIQDRIEDLYPGLCIFNPPMYV